MRDAGKVCRSLKQQIRGSAAPGSSIGQAQVRHDLLSSAEWVPPQLVQVGPGGKIELPGGSCSPLRTNLAGSSPELDQPWLIPRLSGPTHSAGTHMENSTVIAQLHEYKIRLARRKKRVHGSRTWFRESLDPLGDAKFLFEQQTRKKKETCTCNTNVARASAGR